MSLLTSSLLFLFVTLCNAWTSTFTPLRPPALPLAVKSPYMSTWQQAGSDGGNGGYLAGQWPTFWSGQPTGWTGLINVDGSTYTWMGDPSEKKPVVNQTAYEYTSTRSIFTMSVGGLVEMTITFLSPLTPDDLLRFSLPYSYMEVDVKSMDGNKHDVQLYTDISAEWVSGDKSAAAQWSYGVVQGPAQPKDFGPPLTATFPATTAPTTYGTKTSYTLTTIVTPSFHPSGAVGQVERRADSQAYETPSPAVRRLHPRHYVSLNNQTATNQTSSSSPGGVAYHRVWRQTQVEFQGTDQQADCKSFHLKGYWYYATNNTAALTYQSGSDSAVRGQFISHGHLANTEDPNYRPINDNNPVFGFAVDIGEVSDSPVSTLFQLSLHQENCVIFEDVSSNKTIPCLWTSYFPEETSAVEFFYTDYYQNGSNLATSFDNQVSKDSLAAGGQDYLSLTSLAARQAFAGLEFTNTPEKPWVFLKEISSDGNIQTTDVIFPFHPIAVYANPMILKYMLDPLFINQEAGHWPFQFAIHDLGAKFPNATGHNNGNAEMMPIEESGDMIIMTLAYAQRANDNAYLAENYQILKQWNDYLINTTLIPKDQISTDDFAGAIANQTNLAIKGIIAIQAMAEIASRAGYEEDSKNYTNIAHDYVEKWMGFGIAQSSDVYPHPHTTLAYGKNDTFSLLYNKELGLGLVPQSVYDMQSEFYPTVFQKYGVQLDTRHTFTKADWQLLCASVASSSTRDQFISTLAKWLDQTPTNYAFTDLYETTTGNYPALHFIDRPVVGAMFALLALDSAPSSAKATLSR